MSSEQHVMESNVEINSNIAAQQPSSEASHTMSQSEPLNLTLQSLGLPSPPEQMRRSPQRPPGPDNDSFQCPTPPENDSSQCASPFDKDSPQRSSPPKNDSAPHTMSQSKPLNLSLQSLGFRSPPEQMRRSPHSPPPPDNDSFQCPSPPENDSFQCPSPPENDSSQCASPFDKDSPQRSSPPKNDSAAHTMSQSEPLNLSLQSLGLRSPPEQMRRSPQCPPPPDNDSPQQLMDFMDQPEPGQQPLGLPPSGPMMRPPPYVPRPRPHIVNKRPDRPDPLRRPEWLPRDAVIVEMSAEEVADLKAELNECDDLFLQLILGPDYVPETIDKDESGRWSRQQRNDAIERAVNEGHFFQVDYGPDFALAPPEHAAAAGA